MCESLPCLLAVESLSAGGAVSVSSMPECGWLLSSGSSQGYSAQAGMVNLLGEVVPNTQPNLAPLHSGHRKGEERDMPSLLMEHHFCSQPTVTLRSHLGARDTG
jgi:hypothetical protein